MKIIKVNFILFICSLIIACGSNQSLREKVKNWDPYHYTVQYGDTLYSIAWRYDLDFKALAQWNRIASPYTIFPGQKLKMKGPVIEPENKTYLFGATPTAPDAKPENKKAPDYSKPANIPLPPPVKGAQTYTNKIPAIKRNYPVKKQAAQTAKKQQTAPTKTVNKWRSSSALKKGKITWSWPIKGKLFKTFAANNTNRKGIDIIGKKDEKVKAAGDGVVVYSGAGLISYGNLVIIKHSDRFLSAYAHNKRLLVSEGQRVKRGENVAIVGKSSNVTNLLHFEIRKDGKPVNPLVYLP